jgi:outer membrane protein assembly factor BamB
MRMSYESKSRFDRRNFVALAAVGGVAAGAIGLAGSSAIAQDDIRLPMGPATPVPLGDATPPEIADAAGNWPLAQGNYAATRAAEGSAIDSSTVSQLEVAWRYSLSSTKSNFGAITGNPLVVGDTVYFQTMERNVHAVDKATGEPRWTATYDLVGAGGPSGVGVAYGRVYATLSDPARVVALDAATGEQIWMNQISGNDGEDINFSPVVYDSTVYVGVAPGSGTLPYRGGARGGIYALDANSGDVMWRWDTTTDNLWGNARLNSGAGIWYPISLDAEGNIFFGVGNAGPWPGTVENPSASSREGENAYSSSMVSIDTSTGAVRWALLANPSDLFDHDFQNTPILTTATIDGAEQKLAIGSGKTGTVIAANADTGEEIWRTPVGFHLNDEIKEITGDERFDVAPGVSGGVQVPAACANGIVVVQVNNSVFNFSKDGFGLASEKYDLSPGELVALETATGAIVWSVPFPTQILGAATIANDVVFTAGLDGVIRGLSLADGSLLWSGQANAGINAPLAIAGEYLIVGGGIGINPSSDTAAPAPDISLEVIAFKLSGTPATPVSN